jgi:hypothetical protein
MLRTDIPHDFWCIFDNTALGAATADALAVNRSCGTVSE